MIEAKKTVFILSTAGSIGCLILSIAIIFIFRAIEKATTTFPPVAWGVIYIVLMCSFAIIYIIGFRFIKNETMEDSVKSVQ